MSGFLTPTLVGNDLTVAMVLQQPTRITERIASIANESLLVDKIYRPYGTQVVGGSILFNVVHREEFFLDESQTIEPRAPGTQYPVVKRVDPTNYKADVEDWGGKFSIEDERVSRNDRQYLLDQTTQLTNEIVRKIDTRALAVLNAAMTGANIVPGHNWLTAQTVGPESSQTPNQELPAADLAGAMMVGESTELGVKFDTLIVNPQERFALNVTYGAGLQALLASYGLTLYSTKLVAAGTAYVLQGGQVGYVGFEKILNTESWRRPEERISWVQAFAQPAFAVNKPQCCIKITGLAG